MGTIKISKEGMEKFNHDKNVVEVKDSPLPYQ